MADSDNDNDSDSDRGSPLTIQDGLSLESLQALQHFQAHGCFLEDKDDETIFAIPENTVCVSYTPNDSKVIAETYRRLQLKAEVSSKLNQDGLEQRVIQDLVEPIDTDTDTGLHSNDDDANNTAQSNNDTAAQTAARALYFSRILKDEGVVRINNVFSKELAAECLQTINADLLQPASTKDEADSAGFGNVFSRNCRYDMYLRPVGVYQQALEAVLNRDSVTGQLFAHHQLSSSASEAGGVFHEFSALVCDPGAASQPIHPDASYSPNAPLWTVFCALQDVEVQMGPTIFLPATHKEAVHADLSSIDTNAKDRMLSGAEYRRSVLRAGDVAIMDARTLHFGSANTSDKRRVLLYFTIRNPVHGDKDSDFPGCGSLFEGLHMTTTDFW
jgi:hypothetical protein